jgi:hypothetical protein
VRENHLGAGKRGRAGVSVTVRVQGVGSEKGASVSRCVRGEEFGGKRMGEG